MNHVVGALRKTAGLGAVVLFAATGAAQSTGCGAPRDPDLESRALKASQPREAPAIVESTPPPAPAIAAADEDEPDKGSERPVRRYSTAEIATILGRVEGAGGPLTATFTTAVGTFACELFDRDAPETVANFVGLATGAVPWVARPGGRSDNAPYFDGTTFHRAIDDFMIQSGKRSAHFAGGPGWRLTRETARSDAFDDAGVLAMADDGDMAHGSQFFVTLKRDKSLARKFVAFGKCDGLEVVRAIAAGAKEQAKNSKSASIPVSPVKLERVTISRGTTALN